MSKLNNNNNNKAVPVTLFIVSLFVLACVIGLLGSFGNIIKNFIIGVFGLASIPVFVATAVVSVMYAFGRRITCSVGQIIKYCGTVLFIILTFHAITSNALIAEKSFFEYLLACYENTTAGGLIFAIPAYPLMSVSYALALVVFIVLALGLATLSILPEIGVGTGKSRKVSARGKRPTPVDFNSYPSQGGMDRNVGDGLFVSNLSGEKNGDKIQRQRGNLNVNYDFLHPNKIEDDEVETVRINDVDRAQLAEDKKRQAYDSLFNFQNTYESKDYMRDGEELSKTTVYKEPEEEKPSKSDLSDKLNSFLLYQDTDPRSYTNNYRRNELNNGMKGGGVDSSMASYVSKYDELFGAKKEDVEEKRDDFVADTPAFKPEVKPTDVNDTFNYNSDSPRTFGEYSSASTPVEPENNGADDDIFSIFSKPVESKPAVEEKKPLGIFDLNLSGATDVEDDPVEEVKDEPEAVVPVIEDEEDELDVFVEPEKPVAEEKPQVTETERVSRFKAPEGFVRHIEAVEEAAPKKAEPEPAVKQEPRRAPRPYVAPPIDLLANIVPINAAENEREVEANSAQIIETLGDFGIGATVSGVTIGSAVTRYEVKIDRKVSVNSVLKYQNDIAMNLRAPSIRIEAPIPGMDAIGIEVPNKNRSSVGVKRVMERGDFFRHKSPIAFCLGENITGGGVLCDIAEMPHLLIAGTTGSGKSVCLNSLIVSIIYKSSPEDVRLLLIDPKRVELSIFNGLPHLLVKDAICDADKVLNALNWAIDEMQKRLELFRAVDARNIVEYNETVLADKSAPKLPYIVIVVDEFGELMMTSKRDIESKIQRLAQLARAAGIHLILATQRPSVDVITGTIKANLTSRIAFSVSSATDSKTILDYGGAEKLLGKGDMLYMRNGKSVRLQGPFITGKEVKEIVNYVKSHNEAYYDPAIEKVVNAVKEEFDSATVADAPSQESELDPMFVPALKHIIANNAASTSSLSTRFSIGYNRAARLIYQMKKLGYVTKSEGNKPGKVIITASEFEELFGESVDSDDGI